MDKKNTTIGVLLLAAAMTLMFLQPRRPPPPPPSPPIEPASSSGTEPGVPTPTIEQGPTGGQPTTTSSAEPFSPPNSLVAPMRNPRGDERLVALSNDFIEVRFTNYGGAIAEVALKKYAAQKDSPEPYVLNAHHYSPSLAFIDFAGADANAPFTLVSQSNSQVVWRATIADQLEITRTYSLSQNSEEQDPYVVRHETTFRNLSGTQVNTAPRLLLNLGTSQPVDRNDTGQYLNVGYYDGDDAEFVRRGELEGGGFLGMFQRPPRPSLEVLTRTVWASVKNQFFAMVVTPDQPGSGVLVRRVQLPQDPDELQPNIGITGSMILDGRQLAPGASETLGFTLYAGPKEYTRLVKLGNREDNIMQWGSFIGFFSKLLLYLMKALQEHVVHNWGLAIIGTTVIIRTLLWPITASGTRAAKRMAKISGPLKEIQEKYKDNRAKQQEETLKLFKEHKVNPVGGCLPMFVQIPIFFGLFRMLQSASELRFAEFLWARDLSAPDHVLGPVEGVSLPLLGPLALNIFPLLMGATMVLQMRMTPTPTTDNASAKMMRFMPYFVTAICYNFSSGLAVYWTASNCFSIFQQWITNRRKEPEETAAARPGAAERAKPVRDARVSTVGGRKKKK